MSRFVASEAVEPLDWDFTDVITTKGVLTSGRTPEPSTKRINGYRRMIKGLAQDVRKFRGENDLPEDGSDVDDMDDDEALETLESLDEAMAEAEGFQKRTIEALAYLCGADWEDTSEFEPESPDTPIRKLTGGSPDEETLELLPYRVLQAFSQWIMGELAPKRERDQERPTPTDFNRSRKAAKTSTSSRRGTSGRT